MSIPNQPIFDRDQLSFQVQPLFERAQLIALANRDRLLNREAETKLINKTVREVLLDL